MTDLTVVKKNDQEYLELKAYCKIPLFGRFISWVRYHCCSDKDITDEIQKLSAQHKTDLEMFKADNENKPFIGDIAQYAYRVNTLVGINEEIERRKEQALQVQAQAARPAQRSVAAPRNLNAALGNFGTVDAYLNKLNAVYEQYASGNAENLNESEFFAATERLKRLSPQALADQPKLSAALERWKEFEKLLATDPKDLDRVATETNEEAKYTVELKFGAYLKTGTSPEEINNFERSFANWKTTFGNIHCNISSDRTYFNNPYKCDLIYMMRDNTGRPEYELMKVNIDRANAVMPKDTPLVVAIYHNSNFKQDIYLKNLAEDPHLNGVDKAIERVKPIFQRELRHTPEQIRDNVTPLQADWNNSEPVVEHLQKVVLQKVIQQEAVKNKLALQ